MNINCNNQFTVVIVSHIIQMVFFLCCHFFFSAVTTALRDVEVFVPAAVRRGETTRLHCMYDLEGDTLYAVKWYKGRREFYRYTPKENPAMKTFTVNGINVLVSMINNQFFSVFVFVVARNVYYKNLYRNCVEVMVAKATT